MKIELRSLIIGMLLVVVFALVVGAAGSDATPRYAISAYHDPEMGQRLFVLEQSTGKIVQYTQRGSRTWKAKEVKENALP